MAISPLALRELVVPAGMLLEARGKPITGSGLRSLIEAGTPRRLEEAWQAYQSEQAARAPARDVIGSVAADGEGVPAGLADGCEALVASMIAFVRAAHAEGEARGSVRSAEEQAREQTLLAQLGEAESALDDAQAALHEARDEAAALQVEIADARRAAARAEGRYEEAVAERTRERIELHAEISRLRAELASRDRDGEDLSAAE